MPKHSEQLLVYDPAVRTHRGVTLEVTAPQLVLDALANGSLSYDILANEVFGTSERRCVIEVRVIVKNRDGKVTRKR
jgi:hypothetical protein